MCCLSESFTMLYAVKGPYIEWEESASSLQKSIGDWAIDNLV